MADDDQAEWPAYDDYQKKTDREIPIVVLERGASPAVARNSRGCASSAISARASSPSFSKRSA